MNFLVLKLHIMYIDDYAPFSVEVDSNSVFDEGKLG
jgi:hypothetical protein